MRTLSSVDLSNEKANLSELLGAIMPKEAVVVRASQSIFDLSRLKMAMAMLGKATKCIFLEATPSVAREWLDKELVPHDATIALRIPLLADPGRFRGNLKDYVGNKLFLDQFMEAKALVKERNVCISVDLDTSELGALGASFYRLYQEGIRVFLLDSREKPSSKKIKQLSDAFEYLQIVGATAAQIYFPFSEFQRSWNLLSKNTFSGLTDVHVDLSNRCTHSCHFCGIYSQDNIDVLKATTGKISVDVKKFMNQELDFEKAKSLLEGLPWTVRGIQFGGAGDPMIHPRALDIIAIARDRGFYTQVLSNMDYIKLEQIDRLHSLGGETSESLRFIVNCSGGTASTYVKTRPKQKDSDFYLLKEKLAKISAMRRAGGGIGVNFTLMCVVTKMNYAEALEMIDLAKEVEALNVWLKPMEIHADWMHKYSLELEDRKKFAKVLRMVFDRADDLGVSLMEREVLEAIVNENG